MKYHKYIIMIDLMKTITQLFLVQCCTIYNVIEILSYRLHKQSQKIEWINSEPVVP